MLCFSTTKILAQELFPQTEPASNIPKEVIAIKIENEFYGDGNARRSWQGYKFMYGINSKWMISQTFSFSNHHGFKLPGDFIDSTGNGNKFTDGVKRGMKYPYRFENLCVNVKYRFLSCDGDHKHFRMASYLDLAGGNDAHYNAEPNLEGDNSGIGGGIIATLLRNKFAASLTTGFIIPHFYKQFFPDILIRYGSDFNYSLSFGYLLLPRTYKNYRQTNVNLYVEFIGNAYGSAKISQDGQNISIANDPAFQNGNYLEMRPSIQFILHSNTRIDFSISQPLISHSYSKTDPAFYFNIARNFFL